MKALGWFLVKIPRQFGGYRPSTFPRTKIGKFNTQSVHITKTTPEELAWLAHVEDANFASPLLNVTKIYHLGEC